MKVAAGAGRANDIIRLPGGDRIHVEVALPSHAQELGIPLDEHVADVIVFMNERADALGLRGSVGETTSVGHDPDGHVHAQRIALRRKGLEVVPVIAFPLPAV